ncbi:hypothetical protein IPH25_00085 [bacterium]|nr:MAG: hypothetical protein IPG37_02200 [bacterium]QQR61832.1 MAG: hypothetical protein IPH25_00085 [bacterium]QQR62586.1 MAG: hypothetical protein IPH67_04170 [bacterium]
MVKFILVISYFSISGMEKEEKELIRNNYIYVSHKDPLQIHQLLGNYTADKNVTSLKLILKSRNRNANESNDYVSKTLDPEELTEQKELKKGDIESFSGSPYVLETDTINNSFFKADQQSKQNNTLSLSKHESIVQKVTVTDTETTQSNPFIAHNQPIEKMFYDDGLLLTQSRFNIESQLGFNLGWNIHAWDVTGDENPKKPFKKITKAFLLDFKHNTCVYAEKKALHGSLELKIGFELNKNNGTFKDTTTVFEFPAGTSSKLLPACFIRKDENSVKVLLFQDSLKKIVHISYDIQTHKIEKNALFMSNVMIKDEWSYLQNVLLHRTPIAICCAGTRYMLLYDDSYYVLEKQSSNRLELIDYRLFSSSDTIITMQKSLFDEKNNTLYGIGYAKLFEKGKEKEEKSSFFRFKNKKNVFHIFKYVLKDKEAAEIEDEE